MKKLTAIILILSFMLLLSSAGVSATGEGFNFSISSSSVFSFQECPAALSIDSNPGISAGALNIVYDYTKVSFKRYEITEGFSADVVSVTDNKYGQIRFVFLSSKGLIKDTGVVLKLYFVSVNGGVCSSAVTVSQNANAVYDDDYSSAAYSCAAGTAAFKASDLWLTQNSGYALDFNNKTITGVTPGTTPEAFAAKFGGTYELVKNSAYVGTGSHINANSESYYVVVRGDVTGDGVINVMDYITLRLSLLGISKLEGAYYSAADADMNGKVSVTDYISLRLHILGISDLYRQN